MPNILEITAFCSLNDTSITIRKSNTRKSFQLTCFTCGLFRVRSICISTAPEQKQFANCITNTLELYVVTTPKATEILDTYIPSTTQIQSMIGSHMAIRQNFKQTIVDLENNSIDKTKEREIKEYLLLYRSM